MKMSARLAVAAAVLAAGAAANAAAIRGNAGFNSNVLPRNDDGSTGFVGIGFNVNFFGQNFNGGFVNNNGNFTFDGPLSTFTPFNLITTNRRILAPFFADVDTRNQLSDVVRYGQDTVAGRAAFGVNWVNVGYYQMQAGRLNSFQLVVIDRSDIGPGDFDFEFNYDRILWESGQASGGNAQGLGGFSARAGWSNGVNASFELAGSAINGALLDSNMATGLINYNTGTSIDPFNGTGRHTFRVRNGVVQPTIPLPSAAGLGFAGLLAVAARRRRA